MKKLTAIVVLLVLALAAWWFGGPYLAVHGLSRAIEQRDTARLERYVDFPRVRVSLRAQLNDYLVRQAGHREAAPLGAPGGLPGLIWQMARPGDVVVCLGAGNITAWAHALPGQIQQLAVEHAGPRAIANDHGSAA